MEPLETTLSVPVEVTRSGTIRIKGSRVSLESLVFQFNLGATPEQIAQSFPIPLSDVYAVIALYLSKRAAVDEYIRQQEAQGDAIQQRIESDSQQQAATVAMRERMMKRWAAKQHAVTSTTSD
jgi:uncharacterized protein (DUF433 family)